MAAVATNLSVLISEERSTTSDKGVVLLALFEHGRPTKALREAAAHALALGAELHVVRVLPEPSHVNALFPQRNALEALLAVDRVFACLDRTVAWLGDALGSSGVARCCSVTHGEFIEQVARCADQLGARLIVVPPRESSVGNVVTSLACASNRPVLSAREGGRADTILAATDLESSAYPVLWTAAELARGIEATMVAVHNVERPRDVSDADDASTPTSYAPRDATTPTSSELEDISQRLPVTTEPVVRRDVDAVAAILDEARNRDAGLVVVGTRRRGWFEGFVRRTVASRVVARAKRSVLVTPLGSAEELAPLFVGA